MSIYELNINGQMNNKDIDNMKEYLSMIDLEDDFVILSGDKNNNLHGISKLLNDGDFIVNSKEERDDGRIYIKARKKK